MGWLRLWSRWSFRSSREKIKFCRTVSSGRFAARARSHRDSHVLRHRKGGTGPGSRRVPLPINAGPGVRCLQAAGGEDVPQVGRADKSSLSPPASEMGSQTSPLCQSSQALPFPGQELLPLTVSVKLSSLAPRGPLLTRERNLFSRHRPPDPPPPWRPSTPQTPRASRQRRKRPRAPSRRPTPRRPAQRSFRGSP